MNEFYKAKIEEEKPVTNAELKAALAASEKKLELIVKMIKDQVELLEKGITNKEQYVYRTEVLSSKIANHGGSDITTGGHNHFPQDPGHSHGINNQAINSISHAATQFQWMNQS